jgi:hypothetical protein
MSDEAVKVYRVMNKNSSFGLWGTLAAHSSTNILASAGNWKVITADEEDLLFQKYERTNPVTLFVGLKLAKYLKYLKKTKIYPIPGSYRSQILKTSNLILS